MMLYIFDMGGVLVSAFDVLPEAARRMGLDEQTARRLAKPDMDALMAGSMDAAEYWDRFEAASGVRAAEDYWSTLFQPRVDEAVDRFIRGLRSRGRVVCGTNTIASHYDHLLGRGVYDCFDAVYASHHLGVCKPAPRFWLEILKAESARPEDAFFIDDMRENIDVAESLGIRSHLFTDVAGLESALALSPRESARG
jgi:putative hydrolase of the HAD superfamily